MKTNGTHDRHPPIRSDFARMRLAECSVAAVDICRCGMMHLHIGALTLRMAPCAVSELLATLDEAVAHQAARQARESGVSSAIPFLAGERGCERQVVVPLVEDDSGTSKEDGCKG